MYFIFIILVITIVNSFHLSEVELFFSFGDSLSAGFGILNNEFSKLDEYRGLSGFAGCDQSITFPNLLKQYATFEGCSTGQHLVEICYNYLCPPFQYREADHLNVAQSGAMVMNLQHEYDELLSRFQNIPDWQNKKKLGILVIGANDACLSDLNKNANYYDYFDKLFQQINELPNTKLIVFPFFHISGLVNLSRQNKGCTVINKILSIECSSAFIFPSYLPKMDHLIDQMNQDIQNSALNYQNIIVKNIFNAKDISDAPPNFISLVDCFHISQMAHEAIAINMWNSFFGETEMNYFPVINKGTNIDLSDLSDLSDLLSVKKQKLR